MKTKPPVIAIDFDRVIHDIDHPLEGRKMGGIMPGALAGMQEILRHGFIVDVFTLRATTDRGRLVVEDWLKFYGFEYRLVTATKQTDWKMILDDLAHPFIDWSARNIEEMLGILNVFTGPLQEQDAEVLASDGLQQKPNNLYHDKFEAKEQKLYAKRAQEDAVINADYKPNLVPCSFCSGRGYKTINAMGGRTKCSQCGGTGKVMAT
jgi:hypothetical protein